MEKVLIGIFIVLHGLVHLLYFGQSWKMFELQPGMTWPEGSWAFSRLIGNDGTRLLASLALVVAAIGFVVAGIAILAGQAWGSPLLIVAALFSSALYLLMWNGKMVQLDNQGAIGIIINLALIFVVQVVL
ncbi:MAG: hypothetical protein H6670_12290 [Anaerolineaceae bacterium]|nr:hypothetical protein [Anaerolineae bacterium]MCB9460422.1 hypothetical protein [Anaerolineaceae bacterium]